MKSRKVFNKTRSRPVSLLFKGQGTEHTTVKWPIVTVSFFFQAGEAYFVSDDSPVNNFEFFRPLVSDSLGPKLRFM